MMPAGQTIQLVREIAPAGQIVEQMAAQAETILRRIAPRD
jgi:NAD(P)H-dependent flavin oxidoreductase YrpB (nitropropane dioxygenase family)